MTTMTFSHNISILTLMGILVPAWAEMTKAEAEEMERITVEGDACWHIAQAWLNFHAKKEACRVTESAMAAMEAQIRYRRLAMRLQPGRPEDVEDLAHLEAGWNRALNLI